MGEKITRQTLIPKLVGYWLHALETAKMTVSWEAQIIIIMVINGWVKVYLNPNVVSNLNDVCCS